MNSYSIFINFVPESIWFELCDFKCTTTANKVKTHTAEIVKYNILLFLSSRLQ